MALVEGTNDVEGEDEITIWLKHSRLSSLCPTMKKAGYIMDDMHAISYDVDDKETMQAFMAELHVTKAMDKSRLKQALRKLREKTQPSQIVKIIVTEYEMAAMQRLSDQHKNISDAMNDIQSNINKLDEKHNATKGKINDTFKRLAVEIDKQHQKLQTDLHSAVSNKKNILLSQLEKLTSHRQQLSKAKIEYETNIGNTNLEIEDRKKQNLSLIESVLNSNEKYNTKIAPLLSSTIVLKFDENEIIETIQSWGDIVSAGAPTTPIIQVVNDGSNGVKISLFTQNDDEKKQAENEKIKVAKYEIEYVSVSEEDNNVNKMRLFEEKKECIKVSIDKINDDNSAEQIINDLQLGETYLFRACGQNVYGLSSWCSPISLLIETEIYWEFDWIDLSDYLSKNGKSIQRNGNGWNTVARGPTFPTDFINKKRVITWNVRIDKICGHPNGLHFGIAHKDIPANHQAYSQNIGFWYYGKMMNYKKSPSFAENSVVNIVVDFEQSVVEFRENDELLGTQKLNVLAKPLNELCFTAALWHANSKITLV